MTGKIPAFTPPPTSRAFLGGVRHPDLWLWDSWVAGPDNELDLYCLALARRDAEGNPITPNDRNKYAFHVRRFRSQDKGATWTDKGSVITPLRMGDGAFARNIWSGSALDLPDGRRLHAFTGLREVSPRQSFLQTLFLAEAASADAAPRPSCAALLCPARDYDAIRDKGYYLARRQELGANEGEDGGPILAWRDPFLFCTSRGKIEMLWSAKVGPRTPAIGHATLIEQAGEWTLDDLHAPIRLPDAASMTQAEVPKLVYDLHRGVYWLMISACNRINEAQTDLEIAKELRCYVSSSVRGPWCPWKERGSFLPSLDHGFGASFLSTVSEMGTIKLVVPITEFAEADRQLTIGPVHTLDLSGSTYAQSDMHFQNMGE